MPFCEKCDELVLSRIEEHQCRKVEFQIKEYDGDDDWNEIWTSQRSFDYLANTIGERHWSDDPCNPDEFKIVVRIKDVIQNRLETFEVTAEADVNFYSKQLEGE